MRVAQILSIELRGGIRNDFERDTANSKSWQATVSKFRAVSSKVVLERMLD